jgi:predicted nucleic acid-binding protein
MGSLTLPTSGPIYLDANGFIYSVERIEPYRTLLEPMWLQARAGQFEIVSSELVILETLVKPFREGDTLLEGLFRALLHAREVRLMPATAAIWEHAARLRATTGLRTPDALHAATSFAAGSSLFITNDAGFRRVPGLPLVILDDLVREGEAQEEAH